MDDICFRLSEVRHGITGLACLFEMVSSETCPEVSRVSGVGQLVTIQRNS